MAIGAGGHLGPEDPIRPGAFGPGAFDDPLAGQLPSLIELVSAREDELTDPEVADGLLALVKLSGQLDAAIARLADAFDSRILYALDGAPAARGWLAARSELSKDRAGTTFLNARSLRACPVVARAWAEGILGTAKVTMLLIARKQVEAVFAELEAELVDHIAPMTVELARSAIDKWREMALATLAKDDPKDQDRSGEDTNSLHLSQTFQGRWAGRPFDRPPASRGWPSAPRPRTAKTTGTPSRSMSPSPTSAPGPKPKVSSRPAGRRPRVAGSQPGGCAHDRR